MNESISSELERKRNRMRNRIQAYLLEKQTIFAKLETEPPPSWSSHLAEQMFQFFVPIDRAFGNRRFGVNQAENMLFDRLHVRRKVYLKNIENTSNQQQIELFLSLENEIFERFLLEMTNLIDRANQIKSNYRPIRNKDEY